MGFFSGLFGGGEGRGPSKAETEFKAPETRRSPESPLGQQEKEPGIKLTAAKLIHDKELVIEGHEDKPIYIVFDEHGTHIELKDVDPYVNTPETPVTLDGQLYGSVQGNGEHSTLSYTLEIKAKNEGETAKATASETEAKDTEPAEVTADSTSEPAPVTPEVNQSPES